MVQQAASTQRTIQRDFHNLACVLVPPAVGLPVVGLHGRIDVAVIDTADGCELSVGPSVPKPGVMCSYLLKTSRDTWRWQLQGALSGDHQTAA